VLMHQLLIDGASRHPDKMALRWVDRDRSLTYAQAVDAMERMAGALGHLGVKLGDRVTIFAHNGLDYLVGMLGCWRVGAIPALVNVRFADDLAYYLNDQRPTAIIYTHDMGEAARRASREVPGILHLICMDGPQDGAKSLPDLLAANFPAPDNDVGEDAIAHLSYTSGTTGQPKGACLCHEPTVRAARCIAERLNIRSSDISFGPTALSSSYQLVGNLLPQLALGASINVMGRWTQPSGWDAIRVAGATMFVGNPLLFGEFLAECRSRGGLPSKLRFLLSGGGPLPPTLRKAWRDEFTLPLVESFGQSEIGGFFALGYPQVEPDDAKLLRVGPMLPDKEVRIVNTTGEPAAVGVPGEIVLRGGFMRGYWGKPDKTAEALRDGWLHSGDIGVFDADGFLTMRGRRTELLHVAGKDWFPRDIEEALCRQLGVSLAALIGLPDARLGMLPAAFVTTHPGAHLDADRLKKAIAAEVPYDVAPLQILFRDELPMTPTGKISKAQLAEIARRQAVRGSNA
jgi:long-chain acyl-CoA synthetase